MKSVSGSVGPDAKATRTNVPQRLDRLPWSRWHWLVVISLGITWILDGLEVTIVGSISAVLESPHTLALSTVQVSAAGTAYLIGAVLGALFFGRMTDKFGRKRLFMVMISFTYIISGVLLTITGWLFLIGVLNAVTQTICWSIIFFFASTGASAAYLTVSEVFPLEVRALAIALFYAMGTGAASLSPVIFGILIQSGKPINVFFGLVVGALLMAGAGIVAIFFAVDAERKSLESVARPLSFVEDIEEAA